MSREVCLALVPDCGEIDLCGQDAFSAMVPTQLADAPFGEGYVKLSMDLIRARYPERQLEFINKGIGGNTVADLRARWQDDMLRHRPDWLSIKIGINDLHRTLNDAPTKVPPKAFEENYRWILEQAEKKTKARVILIDPFYISQDLSTQTWRGKVMEFLPEYLRVVRKMAREFRTLHVRTHEVYQKQLRYRDADTFCPEPVHPNVSGHLVMAHEFLRAVGW